MDTKQEYIDDLKEIRKIMDRSTRFVTLSGLTGVVAGTAAILVTAFVSWYADINIFGASYIQGLTMDDGNLRPGLLFPLLFLFGVLFIFCVAMTYFLTRNRMRRSGEVNWSAG